MKKKILLFLFFCNYSQTFSQIKINYLNTPPNINGKLNDWKLGFYTFKQNSHKVFSNNILRYAFGFDEEHLYGVFHVEDEQLTDLAKDKSGSPRITFNDSIELYIDTKNNSQNVMDNDDFQIIIDFLGNLTVFRGGDRFLIKVEKYKVPKDTVTNQFVMDFIANYSGTINNNSDVDEGYIIEFMISWAAIGIRPKVNTTLKIDVCLNDADEFLDIKPLSDEANIPNYAFQSINGNHDFGFPKLWTKAVLVGEMSVWNKAKKTLGSWLLILVFLLILGSIWLLIKYLRQKRQVVTIIEKVYQVIGNNENSSEISLQKSVSDFILENLENEISANDLASHLNMSLRQLQRHFKLEFNTTITDFTRKIKLEEAAKMLVSTEMNIAEIAYSTGFSDPAYFSRVFKKHYNQTPKEFQENAQKI